VGTNRCRQLLLFKSPIPPLRGLGLLHGACPCCMQGFQGTQPLWDSIAAGGHQQTAPLLLLLLQCHWQSCSSLYRPPAVLLVAVHASANFHAGFSCTLAALPYDHPVWCCVLAFGHRTCLPVGVPLVNDNKGVQLCPWICLCYLCTTLLCVMLWLVHRLLHRTGGLWAWCACV
jgi:hypothetical protein